VIPQGGRSARVLVGLVQRELVRRRWRLTLCFAGSVGTAVIVQRISANARSVFRDDGDVLSSLLGSPIGIVFPLLVTLVGSLPFTRDVANRGVVNERPRQSYSTLVSSKFIAAGLLSSVVFFLYGLALTLIASVAWPLLGHPGVKPSVYSNVTPFQQRETFADLSGGNVLVFGLLMSLWFAFAAAVYSVLTSASLVLVPNRAVALLLPFAFYLGLTVVLSVLHEPALTPMFSVFPAGLEQSPWLIAASPTLLTALLAAALWVFVVRRPSESRHLL
jgi:hypothetical protein